MKRSALTTFLMPLLAAIPAHADAASPAAPCAAGWSFQPSALALRSNSVYSVLEAAAVGDVAALEARLAEGANPSQLDELGNSPLHYAAQGHSARALELLLDAGADPTLRDARGRTPREVCRHAEFLAPLAVAEKLRERELALCALVEKGDEAGVRAVLATGVSPDARSADNEGTLLLQAAALGKPAIVRALLEAGANANAVTAHGQLSPLHIAAVKGDADTIRELLAAKANPMLQAENGSFPLHDALWARHPEAVRALLPAYAAVNFNPQGGPHGSPLAMAISYGWEGAVSAFVEAGYNPNTPGRKGESMLILAVRSNRPSCVRLMLNAGADIHARDGRGKTAADYATAELAPLLR